MASDEMQRIENQFIVCDRYAISTDVRRIVSRHNNRDDVMEEILDWEWPKDLYRPVLNIHLCVSENIRKERVRLRGNMTEDEKRLNGCQKLQCCLLVILKCDITLDLTGLDEGQAGDAVFLH